MYLLPSPDPLVRVAVGGMDSPYRKLAATWTRELEDFGVKLELVSLEGDAARRALLQGDIQAAFLMGGYSTCLKYKSYGRDNNKQVFEEEGSLRSLGRMFNEPLWVYYRDTFYRDPKSEDGAVGLDVFKDKMVSAGTKSSGSAQIVTMLLHANGVVDENDLKKTSKFISFEPFPDDAKPLIDDSNAPGAVDVALLFKPSDHPTVNSLLQNKKILLMDFTALAGAYINKFPFLSKVVMDRGAFQFQPPIPTVPITLLTTSPALVVHKGMHPILVNLLTHVSVVNPKSGTDPVTGYPVMFHKAGEYPNLNDPEYEIHTIATAYYKAGELPFLLRSLGRFNKRNGIPFKVTAVVAQHGTRIALLAIPILSILIPFSRLIPVLYAWIIRRRLLHWYDRLKTIERTLDRAEATPAHIAMVSEELNKIDDAVSRLRIPRQFSSQHYELRSHINLVDQRLKTWLSRA
jgi:TRAP-type uncharacterized transport system substrate-binding protein